MLCAKRKSDGREAFAFSESKANAPFVCRECDQEVYLRAGTVRVSHFAHKNPDACPFSTGESDEHRRCKMEIYEALLKAPNATGVALERPLGANRPDVFAYISGVPVAIEVQLSALSLETIIHRTEEYARKGIYVLWLPQWTPYLDGVRYSPRPSSGVTVTNSYDLLDRLTRRTWQDGFGEGYGWSTNGLIAHTNRDSQVTRFARDGAGRLTAVTNANTEITRVVLNSLGQATELYDGLNHLTQFSYDEYGRRHSRTDALTRVTSWDYNPNGWVTNRTTPQFGNTTYAYDPVGNLTNIAYPSSAITYAFDALNRLTNMVDQVGATKFGYTGAGQLASEDGPWADDTVSYGYIEGQRTALTLGSSWSQSYAYDSTWRLTNLTSPAGAFGYEYRSPVSTLIAQLRLPNFSTITNHYDALARLDYTGLANRWGHMLDGYAYTHDPLGLRTNVARDFGLSTASATAGYDAIGQLTSWSAKEAGGALRWNEQLAWTYDAAENLRTRAQNYAAANQTFNVNAANELTNVARLGIVTITGNTPSPATNITVTSEYDTKTATRYGDFTFASTNHITGDGVNTISITAQNPYGLSATNTETINLPLSIALQYDRNGNLTNDGARSFFYDAENQLTNITFAGQWKTEFAYDGLGRKRVEKTYGWTGGTWTKTNETRFVYDGLLAIQDRDANNTALVSYTRGLDLSGSRSGAGGIGGLLARYQHSDTNIAYYHADGAGNITTLIDVRGDIVARYLYDPFGNLLGQWGNLADANRYRFSSKEVHPLSGLVYFGFRFYEPTSQRWLNEDPIGETGGVNLHQALFNSPVNFSDRDGLDNIYNPSAGQNAVPDMTVSLDLSTGDIDAGYTPGDDPLWMLGDMAIPGGGPSQLLNPLGPL